MKYYIQTFGCQMNVYDSKSMMGLLNAAGHMPVAEIEDAELILLNTCAIREGAEARVRGRIGQLKKYKDHGCLRYLGVCGCMAQKEGKRLIDGNPHLDLVMGPGAIGSVARLVDELQRGRRPVFNLTGIDEDFDEAYPVEESQITYPRFLSIMKGCDKKCSFCIVPYTRGPERSRRPEVILQEAETLVQKGYKEITLIGQTVNSYQYADIGFTELLEQVNRIPALRRIRFATSHPNSITLKLLQSLATLERVCEHLHLPVQSGSNRILQRMERGYTREAYLERVESFHRQFNGDEVPHAVTTDVIVGFPGETDEDFEQTLDLMRRVRFDSAFMFKFSPRRGTPAAEMKDQVEESVKSQRLDRLITLQHQIARELNEEMIGKTVEVMVERITPDSNTETLYEARLRTGRMLKFSDRCGAFQLGDILNTKIIHCTNYIFYGTPVSKKETIYVI